MFKGRHLGSKEMLWMINGQEHVSFSMISHDYCHTWKYRWNKLLYLWFFQISFIFPHNIYNCSHLIFVLHYFLSNPNSKYVIWLQNPLFPEIRFLAVLWSSFLTWISYIFLSKFQFQHKSRWWSKNIFVIRFNRLCCVIFDMIDIYSYNSKAE